MERLSLSKKSSNQPTQDEMITRLPTLYGEDSKGSTRVWEIMVRHSEDPNAPCEIVSIYGLLGGALQEAIQEVKEGKNSGRANSTTTQEQALAQARSMWNKKRDQNYVEEGEKPSKLLPMLAQKYKDRKNKVRWPAYVQPKLNGVRCLAKRIEDEIFFTSRKGKPYETLGHIGEKFLSILDDGEVWDGEIYHPDYSLQEILSLVKNVKAYKAGKSNVRELQFHAYDTVSATVYSARLEHLRKTLSSSDRDAEIVYVQTQLITQPSEVKYWHDRYVEEGFEGVMVRDPGAVYRCDYRSPGLLKYKEFIDAEFEIVGGKEGTGKDKGTVIFRVKTKKGQIFDVRPKGSHALRSMYWDYLNKFIGKMLTVRYQELTDDGIPRFGVGIAVDDDK
jgi:ATP-dependent DNA ligase